MRVSICGSFTSVANAGKRLTVKVKLRNPTCSVDWRQWDHLHFTVHECDSCL
jgi:hypothetical protein